MTSERRSDVIHETPLPFFACHAASFLLHARARQMHPRECKECLPYEQPNRFGLATSLRIERQYERVGRESEKSERIEGKESERSEEVGIERERKTSRVSETGCE